MKINPAIHAYLPIRAHIDELRENRTAQPVDPKGRPGLFQVARIVQKMTGGVDESVAKARLENAPAAITRAVDAVQGGESGNKASRAEMLSKLNTATTALSQATQDGVLRFASDEDIQNIADVVAGLRNLEVTGDGPLTKECSAALTKLQNAAAQFTPTSDWVDHLDQLDTMLPSSEMPKPGMEWNPSRDTWHAAGDESNFHGAHDMTVPRKIGEDDGQYVTRLEQRALSKLSLTQKAKDASEQYIEDYATHAKLDEDTPEAQTLAAQMNQVWDDFHTQTGRKLPHWEPPLPPALAKIRDDYVETFSEMRRTAHSENARAPFRDKLQSLDAQMSAAGRTMSQHHMPFE